MPTTHRREEPPELPGPQQAHAPQQQGPHPVRIRLRVRQSQGHPPAAPQHDRPPGHAQVRPQPLYVGSEVRGGVVEQAAAGRGLAGAPLVQQHDAEEGGVEEARVVGEAAGSWATMENWEEEEGGGVEMRARRRGESEVGGDARSVGDADQRSTVYDR